MNRSTVLTIAIIVAIVSIAGLYIGFYRSRSGLTVSVATSVLHQRIPFDVSISRSKEIITPNSPARHRAVIRQNNEPVDVDATQQYPHFALISHDLSDIAFYHVDRLANPSNGVYDMDHVFTSNSPYSAWFEINDNRTPTDDHHGGQSDYIAKFDIPVGTSTTPVSERLVATDRFYRLRLEPVSVAVGAPSTFKVHAEDIQGRPVPIFVDIDHFFFAASADGEFYVLDHPDLSLTEGNTVTINNLTLPQTGSYALWIRVFTDGSGGVIEDLIEGSFVFSVS